MFEYRKRRFLEASGKRFVIVLTVIMLLSAFSMVSAETWHLKEGQDWKPVSAKGEDKYLLAVAEVKQLVNTGQLKAVRQALDKLKKDFPEIAGPDLDAFIEGEILFSKGKFIKAVRGYDKLLAEFPESELYQAALDRQFAIATAFLAGRKKRVLGIFKMRGYAEGGKIMEKVTDKAGLDSPIGVRATIAVAQNYEERRMFTDAYDKWLEISSQWQTGQIGKDALLAKARCNHAVYNKHELEKRPFYDASYLDTAKTYYEEFKLLPKDAGELDVDKKLEQINEQMAYKQFSIGQYYERTGNKQSANFYYQMVMDKDDWQETTAAKMAKTAMNDENSSSKEEKIWDKGVKKLEKLFL